MTGSGGPQLERAQAKEQHEPLGVAYAVGDVMELRLNRRFDVVTAIHLLHYLENAGEIASTLSRIYDLLGDPGYFVTMIANPEFDLDRHDALDSKTKFGYYLSLAEPGNGWLTALSSRRIREGTRADGRVPPLGTWLHRWHRNRRWVHSGVARPFISSEGIEIYGPEFFTNYLANPQSKLVRLTKNPAA